MNFQDLLDKIADGDIPGIEFTRQKMDPRVVFTKPYMAGYWECQQYGMEHRN